MTFKRQNGTARDAIPAAKPAAGVKVPTIAKSSRKRTVARNATKAAASARTRVTVAMPFAPEDARALCLASVLPVETFMMKEPVPKNAHKCKNITLRITLGNRTLMENMHTVRRVLEIAQSIF